MALMPPERVLSKAGGSFLSAGAGIREVALTVRKETRMDAPKVGDKVHMALFLAIVTVFLVAYVLACWWLRIGWQGMTGGLACFLLIRSRLT